MQPPISHYKDEDPGQTQAILNQELEKEVSELKHQKKTTEQGKEEESTSTPELKVLPVKKSEAKATNASNIVNAFRQKMANVATPIDLPSAGITVEFKEISTHEQKELSKVALQSNSRADIMYCAMISLINELAVDKKFDIRDYTEFERIQVILNLQQMNKMNPEIKYTCSQCGKENSYRLDTMKLLRNFTKTYKPDNEFIIETGGGRKFNVVAGWPSCRLVEEFFKHYFKRYDNQSKPMKESMDNMSQIEYMLMFMKSISVVDGSDPSDVLTANLEDLTYGERCQIVDSLPQNIMFDEDTGVISQIIKSYIEPINKVFKYADCPFCGAEQEGQVANLSDFMGG